MRIRQWTAPLMAILLLAGSGCSLLSPENQTAFCTAVAVAQAENQSAQIAVASLIALNQQGKVPPTIYGPFKQGYATWRVADDQVINGLVAWNDANASPSADQAQTVATLLVNLVALFMQFQQIYGAVAMSPKGQRLGAPLATLHPVAAVSSCSYTDDQIRAMAPAPWPGD